MKSKGHDFDGREGTREGTLRERDGIYALCEFGGHRPRLDKGPGRDNGGPGPPVVVRRPQLNFRLVNKLSGNRRNDNQAQCLYDSRGHDVLSRRGDQPMYKK